MDYHDLFSCHSEGTGFRFAEVPSEAEGNRSWQISTHISLCMYLPPPPPERLHYITYSQKQALTHGIIILYAINKLPRQLPYSHAVRVYGFDGGCPGPAYAPHTLHSMPLLVGLAKCGHVAKMLMVRESTMTFLGIRIMCGA